ncbi:hypothetical protein D9601_04760 [Sphingomonas sp. MA1305]|uniref:hypothetical protein n=1 Tax=Sphingomonas sp. MA1305 TaxID=2479204 RepID=UPI0018DF62F7|nr:hypothetical protein [Sphingomonas sp. MA1305]MBI0474670.1 hypothetical protein [Sphingomonas sp. MA1305]
MLAGLLFALHDADDRPTMLTATLPFGGVTLIEYQARLLVAAGASQLVIVVARLTPELLGAINRIGRRGIAVDTVRTAAEAAEKLHPLAHVVMLADGLTTTEEMIGAFAQPGSDALLVVPEDAAPPGYERVGGGMVWAGIARLEARRVAELAALPRDYDVPSTLVRLAAQAGAVNLLLPQPAMRAGHAIGHGGAALEARGRAVLSAMVAGRSGWFDRFVVAPIARALIPVLVPRSIPALGVAAGGGALGLIALASIWFGHPVIGLGLAVLGGIGVALASVLADLRDDAGMARGLAAAALVLPALTALLYGDAEMRRSAEGATLALAFALLLVAALGERAIGPATRPSWWGSAPAYLVVLLAGAIVAAPTLGLTAATLYAGATAAAAIERLRRQP